MKARVTREDDTTEIRWRLWLRAKAILVGDTDGGDLMGEEILVRVRNET